MATDLAARQAQLVEADRARRQLLADVSHELMTPLTAIRGYAETLALPQFVPPTKEGQRAVKVIQEEGERIERLVKDLLDLARFEAGGISLEQDNVDVDEIFERVVGAARAAGAGQGRRRSSSIRTTTTSAWSAIRSARAGRAEPCRQCVTAHAARRRGALGASRERRHVKLTVTDNGVGIAPEHLPHVFDRFYKADQSRLHAGRIGAGTVDRQGDRRASRRHGCRAQPSGRRDGLRDRLARRRRLPPHYHNTQQHREDALKQIGVIGEQLEQPAAIDAKRRGSRSRAVTVAPSADPASVSYMPITSPAVGGAGGVGALDLQRSRQHDQDRRFAALRQRLRAGGDGRLSRAIGGQPPQLRGGGVREQRARLQQQHAIDRPQVRACPSMSGGKLAVNQRVAGRQIVRSRSACGRCPRRARRSPTAAPGTRRWSATA